MQELSDLLLRYYLPNNLRLITLPSDALLILYIIVPTFLTLIYACIQLFVKIHISPITGAKYILWKSIVLLEPIGLRHVKFLSPHYYNYYWTY